MTDDIREQIVRESAHKITKWYRYEDVFYFIRQHELFEKDFHVNHKKTHLLFIKYLDYKHCSKCGSRGHTYKMREER